jgi:hypothetical protein
MYPPSPGRLRIAQTPIKHYTIWKENRLVSLYPVYSGIKRMSRELLDDIVNK